MPAAIALAPDVATKSGRHSWTAPTTILGTESDNGCEQHTRICVNCGLIQITMLPPTVEPGKYPWHEFRWPGAGRAARMGKRPLCPGKRAGLPQ